MDISVAAHQPARHRENFGERGEGQEVKTNTNKINWPIEHIFNTTTRMWRLLDAIHFPRILPELCFRRVIVDLLSEAEARPDTATVVASS